MQNSHPNTMSQHLDRKGRPPLRPPLHPPPRMIMCLLTVLALTVEGTYSNIASAGDGLIASAEPGWPQWRGPRRDGISDEEDLLSSWPHGGPELMWKIDGLGTGWSSPIIVGRQLFITGDTGDDLTVFAFDLKGNPEWRTRNGRAWKGPYPGARACCAFSEGRLYNMNAHGRVVCLDAASGTELWDVNILERFAAKNITWAPAARKPLWLHWTNATAEPYGPPSRLAIAHHTARRSCCDMPDVG